MNVVGIIFTVIGFVLFGFCNQLDDAESVLLDSSSNVMDVLLLAFAPGEAGNPYNLAADGADMVANTVDIFVSGSAALTGPPWC